MLITFIVTAAILAVAYLFLNVCNQKADMPNYDFTTGAQKSRLVATHIGFWVPFCVIATEIGLCFLQIDSTPLWLIFGIALLFAVLFLMVLGGLLYTYEAIRGNTVFICRFHKTQTIDVNEIRRIEPLGRIGVCFYGAGDKCLFRVDSATKGIEELIRLINERKSNGEIEYSEEEEQNEEAKAILTQLGREYRESYPKRRKKLFTWYPLVGLVILAAFELLLYLVESDAFDMITIGILGAIALIAGFFSFTAPLKKELKETDLSLGKKYKFNNKKVKGASKSKFKGMCILCIVFIVCGILIGLMPLLIMVCETEPNYEEYTRVTGILEYRREHYGKSDYLAIALYDNPTEYRLSSIYLDELDRSFFSEVKAGDRVTILVDNGEDREFSLRDVNRKQWNDFYYLATEDKEYFTKEDYEKGRADNDRAGFVITGVGTVGAVATAVTLVVSKFVYKKREKEEDIVIYQ